MIVFGIPMRYNGYSEIEMESRCWTQPTPCPDTLEVPEMVTVQIPLTQGKFALVDEEDYDLLSRYTWQAQLSHKTWYARCGVAAGRRQRKTISMHRLLLDAPLGMLVDHKNHDGLDNRRCNLRFASHEQNRVNNSTVTTSVSGYRGVYRHGDMWVVKVQSAGKNQYLGSFHSAQDAARAYDAKARELWGAFAALNFPEDPSVQVEDLSRNIRKSATGYRGVMYLPNRGKYLAQVSPVGRKFYGHCHDTPEAAAREYDELAIKTFGAKAVLNFPEEAKE